MIIRCPIALFPLLLGSALAAASSSAPDDPLHVLNGLRGPKQCQQRFSRKKPPAKDCARTLDAAETISFYPSGRDPRALFPGLPTRTAVEKIAIAQSIEEPCTTRYRIRLNNRWENATLLGFCNFILEQDMKCRHCLTFYVDSCC